MMDTDLFPHAERPCAKCGSAQHGTTTHDRLERLYRSLAIGWLDTGGTDGERLLSTHALARPDRLVIVPCTIGVRGLDRFQDVIACPAISSVLRQGDSDVFTYTLWCTISREFHAKLSGVHGFVGTAALELRPTIRTAERPTT